MTLEDIDLTGAETAELLALSRRIEQEYSRRRVLEEAPAEAEELSKKYREANGETIITAPTDGTIPEGVPAYRQPTGAHDAYGKDELTAQEGKTYRSKIPANVWQPKLHPELWEEVSAKDVPPQPATPVTDAWAAGKAYKVGDRLTYKGKTYRIVQAHTSAAHWTPDAVPALYAVV